MTASVSASLAVVLFLMSGSVATAADPRRDPGHGPRPDRLEAVVRPDAAPDLRRRGMQARGPHLVVDSRVVRLGEIVVGEERELTHAFTVRVFSDRNWILKIAAKNQHLESDSGSLAQFSRLQWRSNNRRSFTLLDANGRFELARGSRTPPSGLLVALDLRLATRDTDQPGGYDGAFELILETD